MGSLTISRIAYHLPEKQITNQQLEKRFTVSAQQIFKNTGVNIRYHVNGELMSDLAEKATCKILDLKLKDEIDAILLVGHGFEYQGPITAALLQHRLGLKTSCLALDLPQGCSGYLNGLAVSKGLLDGGIARCILLLTADTPSFAVHPDDIELLSLFSDSATASIIRSTTGSDNKFVFGVDGSGAEYLMVKRSGTLNPPDAEWLQKTGMPHGKMQMDGSAIFSFALKRVPQLIAETLEQNNLTPDGIDFYFLHQANSFLLETLRKKMKIPMDKFFNDITEVGNTVSSSIPIALKQSEERGQLKRGMKIVLAGFGIGLSWGATVIQY
jgi:3-oxoacyl-[acyl-carrier-protein] synthase III